MSHHQPAEKFFTTKDLCQRYGVVARTVDRWVAQGVLERPIWINGRRYWRQGAIELTERNAVAPRHPKSSDFQPAA
jgi:hypothetical protein